MKKDIKNRRDIELLIKRFYEKVKADEVIGAIFTVVFKVNWEKHLPVMFDFWENTLFFTGTYAGNPMQIHKRIHGIFPLEEKHFQRWVSLFNTTVDELFEGEKALLAKQRAISISTVMKLKLLSRNIEPESTFNKN
jgi:hemoglobin